MLSSHPHSVFKMCNSSEIIMNKAFLNYIFACKIKAMCGTNKIMWFKQHSEKTGNYVIEWTPVDPYVCV